MLRSPIFLGILAMLGVAVGFRVLQSPDALSAIGEFFTVPARAIFIPLILLINAPSFVYIFSALIFFSAVGIILVYWTRSVAPERRALRQAAIAVRDLPRKNADGWRSALTTIGAILTKNQVLASSWTTYAQDAAAAGRLPSRRFALYAESDPWSPFNRRGGTVESLPGYFTTVGLILTFVGLVAALYFAARGFRSGDMAEARASIIQLLNASAFKFLTSVAALMGAFLISVVHRSGQWRLRQATFQLTSEIDRYLLEHIALIEAADQPMAAEFARLTQELAATRASIEALVHALAERRNLP